MIFKKILISIFVLMLIASPILVGVALGQGTGQGEPPKNEFQLENPIKADNFIELLNLIVDAAMLILVPLIVLAIIWVGFLFIKAQGDPGEITKAKEMFMYVIIGAAIILAAKLIITFISETIGSLKP
jgi:hypothetical protein